MDTELGPDMGPDFGPALENLDLIPQPALQRQFTALACVNPESKITTSTYRPNLLMIGSGEYTTGYVDGKASASDKGAGVVALTMFDLRSQGRIGRLGLCGVNGNKFPGIRAHLKRAISDVYGGMDVSLETFPADNTTDAHSYIEALGSFKKGDAVTIFTPDDTHFEIALECVKRGLHVLVTKPIVKTLEQHKQLYQLAMMNRVLVAVEVHKRWDPMYLDARDRIQANLGPFSYMYSYMSQPKQQLDTFKNWLGKGVSDISYYLNSHHIDFHEWCMGNKARPVSVTAAASTGVAAGKFNIVSCEDTITLTVQWENLDERGKPSVALGVGTAVYTSSWIAPKSDVHSQQRFFYMGQAGEISIDQAHRGYTMADDKSSRINSINPLFMKYTPTNGKFSGQMGYGYRSLEAFVNAVRDINTGLARIEDFDSSLATVSETFRTTAVLEAGRRSLDENRTIRILYEEAEESGRNCCLPTGFA